MNDLNPNVLVIVGPTAIGKTALAVDLSEYFDIEIVSADSRQLYRYMDICTAKPDNTQRLRVPHHFIDHINPDETYNAAQYAREALPVIQSIFDRGKQPVI
ncbi:MAG TPA: isopentenyl transferase family protein, partial [bacterium]|nr:isopentenyl transferase family protein [bacterium]